jgi:hypothetical protein
MTKMLVSRRTALKTLGAGAGAAVIMPWLSDEGLLAFAEVQRAGAPPVLRVLTASQYATLEALAEAIIPADERSPGAKEARVADYVDLLLSESDETLRKQWTDGLAALDGEAKTRFGTPFLKLDTAQVDGVLQEISRNERALAMRPRARAATAEPQRTERPTDVSPAEKPAESGKAEPPAAAASQATPAEVFFALAKRATVHGYYTSEIGIHKELRYKGNQILAEFVGCQTVDGKDCPHCGQKAQG